MATICEEVFHGIPVEMVMNSKDLSVTVRSKKQTGIRRDASHDLLDFFGIEPFLAQEVLKRSASLAVLPMSSFLQEFIQQAWEEAMDLDPWYMRTEAEDDEEDE